MKKRIICVVLFVAVMLSYGPFSSAWLLNAGLETIFGVRGHMHKSYFESGDGTTIDKYTEVGNVEGHIDGENCAFEIHNERQLYYFAWLQALGYFNMDTDGDGEINPVYFYLSADLDMTGYILPAIGTEQYPFVGNFDGDGHVIKNLTVSTNNSESAPPEELMTDIPEGNPEHSDLEIVGFFGVIGSLTGDGKVNACDPHSGEQLTGSYTYDNAVNEVHDFTLYNVAVKTETDNTLIGIAAGYVNGKMDGVSVAGSTLNITKTGTKALDFTDNISDYSIVGYCTEDYKDVLDVEYLDVYNPLGRNSQFAPSDIAAGDAWGGSLDMNTLIHRINKIKGDNAAITQLPNDAAWISNEVHFENTVDPSESTDGYQFSNTIIRSGMRYYTSDDNSTGIYYFRDNNSESTNEGAFKMHFNGYSDNLQNKATVPSKTITNITITGQVDAYAFEGEDGYLTYEDGNLTSSDSIGISSKWVFEEGHLYTLTPPETSSMRNEENTANVTDIVTGGYDKVYLNYDGGVSFDDEGSTTWTYDVDNSQLFTMVNSEKYFLSYFEEDEEWIISPSQYYIITDGRGNYLTATSTTAVGNTTDPSQASHWTFSNMDDPDLPQGTISTSYNGTITYLRIRNNALSLSTTNTTIWSNNGNGLYNGTNYIICSNGTWSLGTPNDGELLDGYLISDGNGHYLSLTNDAAITTTNEANATVWSSDRGHISTVIDSTTYYLRQNINGSNLRVTNSTNNRTNWVNSNGKLYYDIGTDRYIRYNGTNWVMTTTAANGTTFTFSNRRGTKLPSIIELEGINPSDVERISTKQYTVTKETLDHQRSGVVCYFPIAVNNDYTALDSPMDLTVSENNTGYFVGGSYHTNDLSSATNGYVGDTRIGSYADTTLSNDYVNNTTGEILRVDTIVNGTIKQITISDGTYSDGTTTKTFNNFLNAKKNFQEVLDKTYKTGGTGYIYGLHFVEGNIDAEHVVVAPYVKFNKMDPIINCPLPENSIDFFLSEKGYITFFAGSYPAGVNGFFSLHKINRDEDGQIASIQEIKYIYEGKDSAGHIANEYIYMYEDKTFSDGGSGRSTTGGNFTKDGYTYTMVFDSAWIKGSNLSLGASTSNAHVYYFEIPANAGEYALGSFNNVNTSNGCYLMYLDIAANRQRIERSETVELFVTKAGEVIYPKGVCFTDDGGVYISDQASAAFSIAEGGKGAYTFTRADNLITPSNLSNLSAVYTGVGVALPLGLKVPYDKTDTVVKKVYRIIDDDENKTAGSKLRLFTTVTEKPDPGGGWTWDVVTEFYDTSQVLRKTSDGPECPFVTISYSCPKDTQIYLNYLYSPDNKSISLAFLSSEDISLSASTYFDASVNYSIKVNQVTQTSTDGNYTFTITGNEDQFIVEGASDAANKGKVNGEFIKLIPTEAGMTLMHYANPDNTDDVTSVFDLPTFTDTRTSAAATTTGLDDIKDFTVTKVVYGDVTISVTAPDTDAYDVSILPDEVTYTGGKVEFSGDYIAGEGKATVTVSTATS